MSPSLEYSTELRGNLDDKTTLRIASLDFDFLEKVSAWVKTITPAGNFPADSPENPYGLWSM